MIGFALVALTYVGAANPPLWMGACAIALIAVLFWLQFAHSFPNKLPRLARYRKQTLTLQAIITFAPFAVFGHAWLGMPGFLGASCLLTLPPGAAWASVAAVVAATDAEYLLGPHTLSEAGYLTVATMLTTLTVFGMSKLAELVREVHTSRADMARMAVDAERLRFARDLHDLLGYSLSAIILKCELAHRLVPAQPERAQQELTEILQAARDALGDVRIVASSYRELSLDSELVSARSILATIGIDACVKVAHDEVRGETETVMATVLREAVTNILRHSKAQNCVIESVREGDSVQLRIANDGLDEPLAGGLALIADRRAGPIGNGLSNLAYRVESLGGKLAACQGGDGWFELTATIPISNRPAA
jgi:two-component system, NarL family, sensor histidine kinase DesK